MELCKGRYPLHYFQFNFLLVNYNEQTPKDKIYFDSIHVPKA